MYIWIIPINRYVYIYIYIYTVCIYLYIYISPEKMYDIVALEHQVVLNKIFFTTIWRCFLVWGDCCFTFYMFLPCGSLRGICKKYVRSIVVFNAFIGCKKGMGSKGRQGMRNFNGNLFLRLFTIWRWGRVTYLKIEHVIFFNLFQPSKKICQFVDMGRGYTQRIANPGNFTSNQRWEAQ